MMFEELKRALHFVKALGHAPYLAEIQVYSLLWRCSNCDFILDLESVVQNLYTGDFLSCDECSKVSAVDFGAYKHG